MFLILSQDDFAPNVSRSPNPRGGLRKYLSPRCTFYCSEIPPASNSHPPLPPLDPKREGPAPLPNSFFLPALPWDMEGEEGEEWGRRHKSSFRKEEVGGEKKIKPQGKRGRGESYLKGKAGAFDEINK